MAQITASKHFFFFPLALHATGFDLALHLSRGSVRKCLQCKLLLTDTSVFTPARLREGKKKQLLSGRDYAHSISLAHIFPQYLSAPSARCNLNSPNTTRAHVTDNYSHRGRHIPGNILQQRAETDHSKTSGVPARKR